MSDPAEADHWRLNGIRIVKAGELDANTAQTPGMNRAAAIYADPAIFADPAAFSGSTLFLGAVYFAFQIYGDFSGYSDIARGLGKLFGIELMVNFRTPYFSRDIAEFWRRWHISLSSWFREYLYIPLGGSRGSQSMTIRNVLIIFVLARGQLDLRNLGASQRSLLSPLHSAQAKSGKP